MLKVFLLFLIETSLCYPSEKYYVSSKIGQFRVAPTLPKKGIKKVLSKLPLFRHFFRVQLPMKLKNPLSPPLPINEKLGLPDDTPWTDPRVQSYVKKAGIIDTYLRIVPKEEWQGDSQKKCGNVFGCQGSFSFLKQIKIKLVFDKKDGEVKSRKEKCKNVNRYFCRTIATAFTKIDRLYKFEKGRRVEYLIFQTLDHNIANDIQKWGPFSDVEVEIRGKYPLRTVYIDGGLTMYFELDLP